MQKGWRYLALDLGAESGRAMAGTFDGERIELEEAHRFATGGTQVLNAMYWDVLRLYAECCSGIARAAALPGEPLCGIGIDTWGVDFGLLGSGDVLLGNPRHYRDHANDGMVERAFERMPRRQLFARTGLQMLQINTLYQLLGMQNQNSPLLDMAETLLFMPDLLRFWLTGEKNVEYTIASTSQMLNANTRQWDYELMQQMQLPSRMLGAVIGPGQRVGALRADVAAETGCPATPFYSVGEHDTASAVAAVPAQGGGWAFLSSGTWSLMGMELSAPVLTDEAAEADFTNEGGVCGTTRFLKNIMGLWLVQECRRRYAHEGHNYSYSQLTAMAEAAPAFGTMFDPDETCFMAPHNMVQAIALYCNNKGRKAPQGVGETVRSCLESLALKYRWTARKLQSLTQKPLHTLHIVGGGSQNRLLCQLAADATGLRVVAGPVEATALGSILLQTMGAGKVDTLAQARQIAAASATLEIFAPSGSQERWAEAEAQIYGNG